MLSEIKLHGRGKAICRPNCAVVPVISESYTETTPGRLLKGIAGRSEVR